jgi:hypothetical protein
VFGQQLCDLPHRGHGDQPTTQAVGDRAATAGSSSAASSLAGSSSTELEEWYPAPPPAGKVPPVREQCG